jgi:ELWxxDGT repeat protein
VNRVISINPSPGETPFPLRGAALGNELVFAASDDVYGRELWITKNSGQEMELLKDILPGKSHSNPDYLVSMGGKVYFFPTTGDSNYELWTTDGTPEGTVIVKEINPGPANGVALTTPAVLGSKIIFNGVTGEDSEIWSN